MKDKLKLTDPNWMFWRVLQGDHVELKERESSPTDYLSRHPLNLIQGLFLGEKGIYNIKPDGWHEVSAEGFREIYFNQPQPPGFHFKRWERVKTYR